MLISHNDQNLCNTNTHAHSFKKIWRRRKKTSHDATKSTFFTRSSPFSTLDILLYKSDPNWVKYYYYIKWSFFCILWSSKLKFSQQFSTSSVLFLCVVCVYLVTFRRTCNFDIQDRKSKAVENLLVSWHRCHCPRAQYHYSKLVQFPHCCWWCRRCRRYSVEICYSHHVY